VAAQPSPIGEGTSGGVWAVPAKRGDAFAAIGTGLPPVLQQEHDQQPQEVAAAAEEEEDISELLGYLSADRA
jgi:hypothetical protein